MIVKMDSALKEIPSLDYSFTAPMAMRLDEAISGVRTELGVKVFGDSLPILERKAAEIRDAIRSVPGAADVSVDVSAGAMQVEIALDRGALARHGLNVSDVRDAVQAGIGGVEASEVIDGRKRFPIVVRLADPYRGTPEAIGTLLIRTSAGARVTLAQVARVRVVEGPEIVNHENGERMVIVQSNVRGRDLGGFAAEVRRAVARRVTLPERYFVTYGGQFENEERAMKRLTLIVPVVLLLIIGFLCELRERAAGAPRHAQRALRAGGWHRRAVVAGPTLEPQRVGEFYRALRGRRAERRCARLLHQPSARPRPHARRCRARGGGR